MLKQDLDNVNAEIQKLESEIRMAQTEAENNIKPLKEEFVQLKEDKRNFASKNDFESVQNCRRCESNIKFKIEAQWNWYLILKDQLSKLFKQKYDLEVKIKLEEDKIKRNTQIIRQMDKILANYQKSQNLKQAAIDSNINPGTVDQWYEWGKDPFNETYSYFYNEIKEIDNYFKEKKSQELKKQMGSVIESYRKTHSLKDAAKLAKVNPDTVEYWYEWGSRGFGEENTYFYKRIYELKK